MHVFTYGSLMFSEVWGRVVKGEYESDSARIQGMCRRAILNELYPGVIKGSSEDRVDGRLYYDVTACDLLLLDQFEGDQYVRQTIMVEIESGNRIEADVYVFKEQYHALLDSCEWDAELFATQSLVEFLNREQVHFDSKKE